MIDLFSFLFGAVAGGIFLWIIAQNIKAWREEASQSGLTRREDARLLAANQARQKKKEEMKKKIVELLQSQRRATREDVENFIRVSNATAARYLDELEVQGAIAQKGENRGTFYELA